MLGAVVVGLGMAGSVRIRDMLAPLTGSAAEQLSVKGFVSRRSLGAQQGAVPQISVSEALNRNDISVAFVCTENEFHEETVRQFLSEGKHVCVEYPMTLNHAAAVELWALSEEHGVVLHEEHIELLTADYKWLKEKVDGQKLQEGTLHFTGGSLKPRFGFLAFSGIARLTWLVDLFGELSVTAASLQEDPSNGYSKMTAQLRTSEDRPLTWIEERGPNLPRAKQIHFCFEAFTLTQFPPLASRGAVGLFMQDLVLFGEKLTGRVSPEALQREKRRVLHCLSLAQQIQDLCLPPPAL
ncbi:unnamed protein product [Knipowitschia caucasica]|uniref:Biliverdin reductase A n=1 Tax=Knipowitschia caucasica TaxID=637954 RepID=A0AAV2JSK6_KNICA